MTGLPASSTDANRARLGRRVLALVIDWLACSLIGAAFLGYTWGGGGANGFIPLGVFAVENLVLLSTIGSTLGHRILGLRVVGSNRRTVPGLLATAIRTALLCLAVPAVITGKDGRGWHDIAAGTAIVSG